MPAPIEFDGYRIRKITFERKDEELSNQAPTGDGFFTPEINLAFNNNYSQGLVEMKINLQDSEERFISVEVDGFFSITDENIDKSKAKQLLALNGTSILFPYTRSIISMITSLDSPKAMVMPTVNVQELFSEKKTSS